MKVIKTNGEIVTEVNRKLTTPELKRIFGGWYLLLWASKSAEGEDFYIAFKDLYNITPENYPPYNRKASKLFGRDLYGDVIYTRETTVN